MNMRIGELFLLGFRGNKIPSWLFEFERKHGLGGVILFDYDYQAKKYENNIQSLDQVEDLCGEISRLESRPLIFIDQEGGKVRRLKESKGFAPLPSQFALNKMREAEKYAVLRKSFLELRALGFDFNLAPVIDLNLNPQNPDIGAVERSYSADPKEVRANVEIVNRVAVEVGLGLCLKHYPGLGGATVNSHLELTDLSDSVRAAHFEKDQLSLFWDYGKTIHGQALILSHGVVRQWDSRLPTSMSKIAIHQLRSKLPDALLISDDLQMQGLQKIKSTEESCLLGLQAGLDMLCIGNNLMHDDLKLQSIADGLLIASDQDLEFKKVLLQACNRVRDRKTAFKKIS